MVDQPDFLKFPSPDEPPNEPQDATADQTADQTGADRATPQHPPRPLLPTQPQCLLCLEVTRGRTAYPYRPIEKPKFRLGSGPACDLRLGAPLAPVHSMIFVEGGRAWAEQVAADPPLMVNGTPRRRSDLQTRDRLQIGDFEMVFWQIDWDPALLDDNLDGTPLPDDDPGASDSTDAPADIEELVAELTEIERMESLGGGSIGEAFDGLPEEETDLSQLSAAELIERIEQEEEFVAAFEAGRERGAAALLFRVAMQAAELRQMEATPIVALESEAADGTFSEYANAECADEADCLPLVRRSETARSEVADFDEGLLGELEEVVARLSEFSAQLDRRAERLAERELSQAEAAAGLLTAQEELASQLERLHEQLATPPRQDREPSAFRKAA